MESYTTSVPLRDHRDPLLSASRGREHRMDNGEEEEDTSRQVTIVPGREPSTEQDPDTTGCAQKIRRILPDSIAPGDAQDSSSWLDQR
ncbi:hypothetical protein GDO81_020979 [Engystomops pustulosus]|uniref:Uncharacterized protein n=1 Tax=Engystomops pustulosus TaxID=76066 RepID=A0AAV6ZQA4_ENGPU|nr:hypothetical protein GDO81_020979 [Engystomops pustulosus]